MGKFLVKNRQELLHSLLFTICVVQVCASSYCLAGGLELYELGTPALGLAGAGEAARAQDASTLFTNPAGMTRLERSQILIGVQPLFGDSHFDRDPNTSVSGDASGNPVGFVPGGSFFYVHSLNEDWKFGFGSFSYFGLPLDFANDWSGRYYAQDTTLAGMTFMPSLAYRASEQLSFGVGLNAMYGIYQLQTALKNANPEFGDGKLEIGDGDWGFGADLGVMYEPTERTRFGLRYLSQVNLDFKDSPDYENLGPGLSRLLTGNRTLDLGMNVPTDLMLSAYHELTDEWAILVSGGWQDWSRFGHVDVGIGGQNQDVATVIETKTKDTWHVSLGVQNRTLKEWIFSTGVAYDSSMVADEDRPVTLPVGEMWRFGLGAQYLLDEDVTLGLAYELNYAGDMPVDQQRGPAAGRISGEYGNTALHYWGFSVQWKL